MDRRTLIAASAAGTALSLFAGARAATPAREIMGVGWYVVFSRPSMMDRMTAFYEKTLGLPEMLNMRTDIQNKNYLWGGEDIVVDLAHHAPETPLDPREADPARRRQFAIFRTDNLDALMAGFAAQGAMTLPARPTYYGREAFVIDPMGRLIGFRPTRSGFAVRVRQRSSAPLCAGRGLQSGQRRDANAPTGTGLGAPEGGGYDRGPGLLWRPRRSARSRNGGRRGPVRPGDNTTLEIVGGGVARPVPPTQSASETVAILRVVDFPATLARLKAAGQPFPFKIYSAANGGFSYISDPEGNLLGLADRKPPAAYKGVMPIMAEDLEARRRWVETTAGGF